MTYEEEDDLGWAGKATRKITKKLVDSARKSVEW